MRPPLAASFPHANLPSRLSRMVGRDDDVLRLSAQLTASRIVTIVGAGGIGKTTVAVAVGHHLSEAFGGAVLFVDFGMLSDPDLVAPGVASMLGLAVGSDDARPSLIAYLRDKRILLILDTCEHLIDAVATLAASIIEAAPQVHILTTSREALRIDGERVYRLDALACPPDDPEITAAAVLSFPATQLFVERAAASGARLDISDADARIVAAHLPKARRRGARDGTGGQTGRDLRPAADRRTSRPASDAARGRGRARRRRAKGPCRPRSTGVSGCSPSRNAWCFAGSRYSSGTLRSMRRSRS